MVRHAYRSVPYYRDTFDRHGVNPEAIRSVADLQRIPISDKTALQSLPPQRLVATGLDPDHLLARSTSGSDGRPFTVYRTWLEQNLLHLFRFRAQRLVGLRLSDRFVTVGLVRERLSGDDKLVGRSLSALGLYRRWRVDIFQELDAIIDKLEELRPDVIGGYPGILARIADGLGEGGAVRLRPRLILSGAEMLTPLYRRRIEAGFGAPVFDLYGCHELNLVAWQCPATGLLHTCDDASIVEVLHNGRPAAVGEPGEVVVTGLYSYAMPFLRYRLGDLAVRGEDPCPCGEPFATLHGIEGRLFEHFVLPGGRVIHPHRLGRVLLSRAGAAIRQYQIVQERIDLVEIRIVPDSRRSLDIPGLERLAREMLGPTVRCEIRLVREIPIETTGKYRIYKTMVDASRIRNGPLG